jgi:hypothetical protein
LAQVNSLSGEQAQQQQQPQHQMSGLAKALALLGNQQPPAGSSNVPAQISG